MSEDAVRVLLALSLDLASGREPSPMEFRRAAAMLDIYANEIEDRLAEQAKQSPGSARMSDDVIEVVSRGTKVTREELTSRCRTQHVAFARQLAMYMLRQHVRRMSFPRIGMIFRRDHSTVFYACQMISRKIAREAGFAAYVARLDQQIVALAEPHAERAGECASCVQNSEALAECDEEDGNGREERKEHAA